MMKNISSVTEILTKMKKNDIHLWLDGDSLKYDAPEENMTSELLSLLKENKKELIGFFEKIKNAENITSRDIVPVREQKYYDLSHAQKRLWILDQIEEDRIAYNIPSALVLEGELNEEACQKAYSYMIVRHESLRTVFIPEGGEPKQKILQNPGFKIEILDMRNTENTEPAIRKHVLEEMLMSFDLKNGPLLRFTLLKIEEKKYILLFNMHHIISDGWSMGIFPKEFMIAYDCFKNNKQPPLTPLKIHYKDYSAWQNNLLKSSKMDDQRKYWHKKLSWNLPVLDLPGDRVRPAMQTFKGRSLEFFLSRQILTGLNQLSKTNKTSLFVILQALVKTLLHKYTGQEDIITGTAIAGRIHKDLENQIGFYVNTLALRDTVKSEFKFNIFLHSVKKNCEDAMDNQAYPFDKLVEEIELKRDISRSPLFDVMVVLQNTENAAIEIEGLKLTPYQLENKTCKFDMGFSFFETTEGLRCVLEYNTDIYNKERMERTIEHFKTLAGSVIDRPESKISDLEIIPKDENNLILNTLNDCKADYPKDKSIIDIFEEQVDKYPYHIATIYKDRQLTYQEINQKANVVARYLTNRYHIETDDFIGVKLNRSDKMIISLLGILKAGGAYMPIDPEYPQDRTNYILKDSNPKAVICREDDGIFCDINQILNTDYSLSNPSKVAKSKNLAYVIYTSGSTGKPKGVLIEHSGFLNMALYQVNLLGVHENDVVLQFASASFDASLSEIFMALFSGAALAIPGEGTKKDIIKFQNYIMKNDITVATLPPVYLKELDKEKLKNLRAIISAGEKADVSDAVAYSKFLNFFNGYGPTEASVCVSMYKVDSEKRYDRNIPIGKPVSNCTLYILDKNNKIVPIGVSGELCATGQCLARGYLNKPELTQAKFVENPFKPGKRMYRTGDLVRWLPDGNIEYLGRVDNQVKIRGFRIELEEIENELQKIDYIKNAVVVEFSKKNQIKYLCAYYTREENHRFKEIEKALIDNWKELYQNSYKGADYKTGSLFIIKGWNSSYTGKPIEAGEMDEWVENTVSRIKVCKPDKIYEIGCGSGLLMYKLAPHCTSYWGSDFSEEAVKNANKIVSGDHVLKSKIKLSTRAADDFKGIPENSFDTIIINSVVQYFPTIDYLYDVIKKSIKRIEKNGMLFIGDIRNYDLLEVLHTSINLFKAEDNLTSEALKNKITQSIRSDNELLISPGFFYNLKDWIRRISHVEIKYKKGHANNELTKFRYDVILHVEKEINKADVKEIYWDKIENQSSKIEKILKAEKPDILYINEIINKRIESDWNMADLLSNETVHNLEDLFKKAHLKKSIGIDFNYFEKLDHTDYYLDFLWSGESKKQYYDAIFIKNDLLLNTYKNIVVPRNVRMNKNLEMSCYANNPLEINLKLSLNKDINKYLSKTLPDYMIPSFFIHMEDLPVTHNGKIDREALPDPEIEGMTNMVKYAPPMTSIEKTLTRIWKDVLGRKKDIGIDDNYLELGGDSIKAIQIMSRLNQKGLHGEVVFLFKSPTIRELALMIENNTVKIDQSKVSGIVPLTPIQKWFFYDFQCPKHHFNQSIMINVKRSVNISSLKEACKAIIEHHDVLRMAYKNIDRVYIQENRFDTKLYFKEYGLKNEEHPESKLKRICDDTQDSIDLENDTLIRFVFFQLKDSRRLLIVAHHLIIDGVSWRILLEDLRSAYLQAFNTKKIKLPLKTTSFKEWSHRLEEYAASPDLKKRFEFWKKMMSGNNMHLPNDRLSQKNKKVFSSVSLSRETTELLLTKTSRAYNTGINDILLTALVRTFYVWCGLKSVTIDLESHGRSEIFSDINLSRTVGWFTNTYPIVLSILNCGDLGEEIVSVKEQLRAIPNNGIDFGIIKYLSENKDVFHGGQIIEISFNYLGQFDMDVHRDMFEISMEPRGNEISPLAKFPYKLSFNGMIGNGCLIMNLESEKYEQDTVNEILLIFKEELKNIIQYTIKKVSLVDQLSLDQNNSKSNELREVYI